MHRPDFSISAFFLYAAGGLVALLGAAVLTGWHTHADFLIHLRPGWPDMSYNTALAFLFGGIGLMAATGKAGKLATALANIIVLLAIATLGQYLLGFDSPVDQLFGLNRTTPVVGHAGRMSPAIALAFLIVGSGLMALSFGARRGGSAARCAFGGLAGTGGAVIGGFALLSYIIDLRPLFNWGLFTSMSVHTAVGFIVLGGGIMILAYRRAADETGKILSGIATVVVATQIALTLLLWDGLQRFEEQQLRQQVKTETHALAGRFEVVLHERAKAIHRMAERWEASGGTPRSLWSMDAAAYLEDMQGFQAIQWVDAEGRLRWSVPEAGHEAAIGQEWARDPAQKAMLNQARNSGSAIYAEELSLDQGKQAISLARMLKVAGRFDGYLVAIVGTEAFLSRLTEDVAELGYDLDVTRGGVTLYRHGGMPDAQALNLVHSHRLDDGYGDWEIRLWPSPGAGLAHNSALPGLALAGGLVLTLFTAMLFWTWQRSMQDARQLRLAATVFDNSHEAITITDPGGAILSVNSAFTQITGYTPAEVIGKNPNILYSGRQDAAFYQAMWASIREKSYWSGEIWNLRKDGEIYPELLSITEVRDVKGGTLHYIGMFIDITERKKAERELQDSAQHTQAILDNVLNGIITSNEQGSIASFNRAAETIFGYTASEIVGRDFNLLLPEHGQIDISLENLPRPCSCCEMQGKRRDGTVFAMELSVSEISRDGQRLVIFLVRDVTESKQAKLALIAAKEEAERANQAKSEFLSCMSHELRTPLNAVMGFAQLIEMDATLAPEHRDSADQIYKAGLRLNGLVNEVLDLSKIDEGNIDLAIGPVECASLIDECLSMVTPLAQGQNIRIVHADADAGPLVVLADFDRIKQVLLNLLSNAIKFNRPEGTVRMDVAVAAGDQVRLTVSDTGRGISPELRPRLFQPFERHEVSPYHASIEGTGIGLAVCKRLVEAMNGHIEVESEVGLGSHFHVILPAAMGTTE